MDLLPGLHDTTGCLTGLITVLNEQPLFVQPVFTTACIHNTQYNWFDNRLYRVYKHLTGCQTGLATGLTTGCIV